MILRGTFTAIVTPFNADNSVDYGALRELVKWQIDNGVDGIVPVGTTGESPTLGFKEHADVIMAVAEAASGKVKIIAGTGANSTAEAVALTMDVLQPGIDATLQVTPYYNKPNAEGLYRHFMTIAELGLPVVLYNVPGRTSREIPLDVVARLAGQPNIAAIKEAGGSVDRVSAIRNVCDLPVLCGDDGLTLPMISVGACGVISVASNVIPKEVSTMVRLALNNDFPGALRLHAKCFPLFRDLFIDTNPIPVKTALSMMGRCGATMRLPLCEPTASVRAQLIRTMQNLGLL